MSRLKRLAKSILPPPVWHFMGAVKKMLSHKKGTYSFQEEEVVIRKYLNDLTLENNFCVDIAASDGISMSNTYSLFKAGWEGIAVEFDPIKFAKLAHSYSAFTNVSLLKTKVIPENVVSILKSCMCPEDFALLNLDIDSYDYFVLDTMLDAFRPRLICVEINEKVPPPIKFTVTYDSNHVWAEDHFYGQSISKCHELCVKHKYDIVELHYNNLFIVPREINKFAPLSPEAAYDAGYRNRADRKEKFPWNSDMEDLLTMGKNDALQFLKTKFAAYDGKYTLE
jgi:hypothetical protein